MAALLRRAKGETELERLLSLYSKPSWGETNTAIDAFIKELGEKALAGDLADDLWPRDNRFARTLEAVNATVRPALLSWLAEKARETAPVALSAGITEDPVGRMLEAMGYRGLQKEAGRLLDLEDLRPGNGNRRWGEPVVQLLSKPPYGPPLYWHQ